MRILSPVGERRQFVEKQIDRGAQGSVIGLVNNGFGNEIANVFFKRLQELLLAKSQVSQVSIWRKPMFTRPSPEHLIDEVASVSQQAVVGLCA